MEEIFSIAYVTDYVFRQNVCWPKEKGVWIKIRKRKPVSDIHRLDWYGHYPLVLPWGQSLQGLGILLLNINSVTEHQPGHSVTVMDQDKKKTIP